MCRHAFFVAFVAALGAVPVAADEPVAFSQRSSQRTTGHTTVPAQGIGRWARELVDEIEHLEEDLHYERGKASRELYGQVDQTLQTALHFERVVQQQGDRAHLARDFEEMDRKIHQLVNSLSSTDQDWMHRAVSRIQYADQQLHYRLSPRSDDQGNTNFSELLARHAHVLEQESRQLAQSMRRPFGRASQPADLAEAIESFADAAEHFHASVERGADREHLRSDFSELDSQWHQIADRLNRSQYGMFLRSRAARVNQVHNQVHDLVGAADHHVADYRADESRAAERRGPNRRAAQETRRDGRQRPRIQFEIPGVGRFQF